MKKRFIISLVLLLCGSSAAAEKKVPGGIYSLSDFMTLQHHFGTFFYNDEKTVMVAPGITLSYQELFFGRLAGGLEMGFKFHHYDLINKSLADMKNRSPVKDAKTSQSKNFYIGPSLDYYYTFSGFKLMGGIFLGFDEEVTTITENSIFKAGDNSQTRFLKHSFALKVRCGASFPLGNSIAFFVYYRIGILYSDVAISTDGSATDSTIIQAASLDKTTGLSMVNSISCGVQYYR